MSDNIYNQPPPPPPPGNAPPPGEGYGYGSGPVEHPKGTMILVLGILSLVCCSPLGIAAWVMGNTAMKEIDAAPMRYTNRGVVQAGRICGIIGSVLLVISVIWLVGLGGLAIVTGSTSGS